MAEGLADLKSRHPTVGDVRGLGLFWVIELVKDKETKEPLIPWTAEYYEKKHAIVPQLVGTLKQDGLHTYMWWNMLMISPPLCITREELAWGLDTIDDALDLVDAFIAQS